MGLTYAGAGVRNAESDAWKSGLGDLVRATARPEVLSDMASYCSLFAMPAGYGEPVIAASTDGVGTKCTIATALGRLEHLGQDLVAMCVNDLVTVGAAPLFFLDYIAVDRFDAALVQGLVASVARACSAVGCALVGGETAQMPGVYVPGHFDLAGFVVGVAERSRLLGSHRVRPGDVLLGLPSSGLHSNGFSLVRAVLGTEDPAAIRALEAPFDLVEELVRPTRLYAADMAALAHVEGVRAAAHITGGGLPGNVPRILPEGLGARFERKSWSVPPIFAWLADRGAVAEDEMYRTFNMGLGLVVVAAPEAVDELGGRGFGVVGRVEEGTSGVHLA